MANNYKDGKYRISIAGDARLQNKPVVITDSEGGDVLDNMNTSYINLSGKPKVNGVPLVGNKTSAQLGVADLSIVAPAYDETATYEEGDVVVNSGGLYVCTTAVETAEKFDKDKWTATTIVELILSSNANNTEEK